MQKQRLRRALILPLAAALLLGGLPSAHAQAALPSRVPAVVQVKSALDPSVSAQGLASVQRFEKLLNDLRAKNGKAPLKFNLYATQDAYRWAKIMGQSGNFRHSNSAAERPSMTRFTGSWATWGENIAARSNTDIDGLFKQWIASAPHLANMLSSTHQSYGVGFYIKRAGDKGEWALYATTVFYSAKPGKSLAGTYSSASAYAAAAGSAGAANAGVLARPAVTGGSAAVSGTARVGVRLRATSKAWGSGGLKYSYRWYRNGAAISRATASSYVPVAADRGKRITVKVTASRSGWTSRTVTSKRTKAVAYGVLASKSVKVSGIARVARTLTAKTAAWGPSGVKLSYRWYRSGKAISGATARTYKVKSADRGRTLKVRVSGSKKGYAGKAATSRPTSRVR